MFLLMQDSLLTGLRIVFETKPFSSFTKYASPKVGYQVDLDFWIIKILLMMGTDET